jgi:hypothetical protein
VTSIRQPSLFRHTRYDAANQLRTRQNPAGGITSYAYTTTFTYDATGNLRVKQDLARVGTYT